MQFLKSCDDQWDCSQGKCTAYEKALQICLSRLAPEAYQCNYVQGKPDWGVAASATQLSQSLKHIIGIVCMFFLIAIFILLDVDEFKVKWDRSRAYWMHAMIIAGVFLSILQYAFFAHYTPKPRLESAGALSEPCNTGATHVCAAPQPEEAAWNHDMSPAMFYAIHVALCVGCCCCFGCHIFLTRFVIGRQNNESTEDNESSRLLP
jgi:hypothetical protein